jgi:hypothetical protein
MGSIDPRTGDFNDGNPSPADLRKPLAVTVGAIFSGPGGTDQSVTLEGNIISLNSNLGQKALCFPQVTFTPANLTRTFFYSTRGTPYYDQSLRKPAMAVNCDTLLANAFVPYAIDNVTTELPIPGVQSPRATFARDHEHFGYYDLALPANGWSSSYSYAENQNVPLVVTLAHQEETEQVFPARTFSLDYNDFDNNQGTMTLCVPELSVPGLTSPSYYNDIPLYYDTNGTPYSDALLTNSVSCGETSGGGDKLPEIEVTP